MKISEFIARLSQHDPESEVMILDGPNGDGSPRDINFGPTVRSITASNAQESADCEDRIDEKVVLLGFGCY